MRVFIVFFCLIFQFCEASAPLKLTDEQLRRTDQVIVDQIYDILELTHQIFSKHHLHYCIAEGTFLGAVRHGGLIPWDDDADIAILKEDLSKFLKLKKHFRKKGYTIRKWSSGYKIFHKNGTPQKKKINFPSVDVFIMKKDHNRYIYASSRARRYWPNYFIKVKEWKSITKVSFGHLTLKGFAANVSKKYLDRVYGNDWNEVAWETWDHEHMRPIKPVPVKFVTRTPARRSGT